MAKAKKTGTNALVPIASGSLPDFGGRYQSQMARQQASTPLSAGMPRIQAGQGMFILPGMSHGVETFDAIALVALRANRWHEAPYDPKAPPSPPDCVAIARLGMHENAMAPNPAWPKVQAAECLRCSRNTRGGRKECRNGIDVALVSAQGDGIDWEKTTIVSHTISSTGIQPWGKTLAYLAEKKVPLFAAVLRFKSVKEQTWYVTIAEPVSVAPMAVADLLAARVEEAERALLLNCEPFAVDAGAPDTSEKPPVRRQAAQGKSRGKASARTL